MIEIPLSQGFTAFVDDEDLDLVQYKWHAFVCSSGIYARRNVLNDKGLRTCELMHRVILERKMDVSLNSKQEVDHVDCNGLNNTRNNLRFATRIQNSCNTKLRKNNKSGLKGVSFDKLANRWRAQIEVNFISKYIGLFDTREEAHEAYKQAALKYHGDFANFG